MNQFNIKDYNNEINSMNVNTPIDERIYNFLMNAKEPLLFLSCCIELKNYYANPKEFISKLPVYLDATCSGLQHLSTMINDTYLAKYVNITSSNENDLPKDVYSYMIAHVETKIKEYIKNDNSLAILDNIIINREFIKPGIMTISYGATNRGISEQLRTDHFRQNDLEKDKKLSFLLINNKFNKTNFDINLTYRQVSYLGKAIHSVLFDVFPNLNTLVNYLKNMNKMLKGINQPTI